MDDDNLNLTGNGENAENVENFDNDPNGTVLPAEEFLDARQDAPESDEPAEAAPAPEAEENGTPEETAAAPDDGIAENAPDDGARGMTYEEFIAGQNAGTDVPEAGEDGAAPEETAPEGEAVPVAEDGAEKRAKKKKNIAAVILSVVIVVLFAATGLLAYKLISKKNSAVTNATVLTVNGVESKGYEFLTYYMSYSQYYGYYLYSGSMSQDELTQLALDQLAYTNALYKAAKDAGLKWTDEDEADFRELEANITAAAEEQSLSTDEYLSRNFEMDLDKYRELTEKQALAQHYIDGVLEELSKKYEGEEGRKLVTEKYESSKADYLFCDALYVFTQDAATATKITDDLSKGASFAEAAGREHQTATTLSGGYDSIKTNMGEEIADWLFEEKDGAYVNGAGAVKLIANAAGTYVVYVNSEPSRDEYHAADLDYVFVAADSTNEIKSETELMAEASATADAIVKRLSASETVEDVMKDYADSALVTSGSFDGVKRGAECDLSVVNAVRNGISAGDVVKVEGAFNGTVKGYYVLVCRSVDEDPVWYSETFDSLLNADRESWVSEFTDSYKDSVVTDQEAVKSIIDALSATNSAQ